MKPLIMGLPVSTSDKGTSSQGSQDQWSNSLGAKPFATDWFAFQNIDGLSQTSKSGDTKLTKVRQWITLNVINVFAFVEYGTSWDLFNYIVCLPQKMRGWWEAAPWSVGYNQVDKQVAVYQPGGMGILITNHLVHQTLKLGNDPSGMGH